jgi:hypothetical protein
MLTSLGTPVLSQDKRKLLRRSASRSATNVRHNDQLQYGNIREINLKFLALAICLGRAEIPLLAHDFSKRTSAIRRTSQDEFLGAL